MADTVVTLGDFAFERFEVPPSIPFGGAQKLVAHKMVGGARVIDAMGRDDANLKWSGLFEGKDAIARASYLDALRIAGKPLELVWSEYRYTVVIEEFHPDFKRFYRIPYSINCMVVEDQSAPVTSSPPSSVDYYVEQDLLAATPVVQAVNMEAVTACDTALRDAITAAGDLSKASINMIGSVLKAVSDGMAIVKAARSASVASSTVSAAALLSAMGSVAQSASLARLESLYGRIGSNINSRFAASRIVTIANPDFAVIASQEYGTPNAWPTLALANGVTDPRISGIVDVVIPRETNIKTGVLPL